MELIANLYKKLNRKPTIQEIEDEIFNTMAADKKIKIVSDLIAFTSEINHLENGNNRPQETATQSSSDSR